MKQTKDWLAFLREEESFLFDKYDDTFTILEALESLENRIEEMRIEVIEYHKGWTRKRFRDECYNDHKYDEYQEDKKWFAEAKRAYNKGVRELKKRWAANVKSRFLDKHPYLNGKIWRSIMESPNKTFLFMFRNLYSK